jgi:hypothetical protein
MSNNIVLCEAIECTECPICMVEIIGSTNRVTTECGHEFHTKCLLSNVAYNGFGCPYCRSEMVEESVANHLHEDEEDEEDEDDDDEEDDEYDDEIEESDILRGLRFMLQRVTGDILTDENDIYDEDDYENELLQQNQIQTPKPKPSLSLIVKKLLEEGVTNESLVRALLFTDHPEYNDEDDHSPVHEAVYDLIRNIINNYTIEQEEELLIQHNDNHHYDDFADEIENNNNDSNNKYDFYFLQKEFIDNCKQNHNFSFILEETILPIF